jgi:superfamily II DNA or RNA helicase
MPAFDGLRERVHPSAVLRAETYVRQGRVLEVSQRDPKTLVGLVQGSLRTPYRCLLRLDLEEPDLYVTASHCSCYVGGDCAHAVAVLLAAQAARQRASDDTRPGAADRWLRAVEGALAPRRDDMTHARLRQLVYVLRPVGPGRLVRGVICTLWQAARRRDGSLGRLSPFEPNGKVPLDAADDALVASLGRHHGAAATPWSRAGEVDQEMLLTGPALLGTVKGMAASGRCRWSDADGPTLAWGPPRHGEAAWELGSDGAQRLGLVVSPDPAHIVLTDPALYIDVAARRVGELAMAVPEALLSRLDAAPPVPLEAVDAFIAAVPPPVREVMPLPRAYDVRPVEGQPVACLHVQVSRRPADGAAYVRGVLGFDYGGVEVDGDAPQGPLYRRDGDAVLRMTRDRAGEVAARRRLEEWGATALTRGAWRFDLGDAGCPQARHDIAHRLLTTLAAAGWRIAGDTSLAQPVVEGRSLPEAHLTPGLEAGWFTLGMDVEVEGRRVALVPLLLQALAQIPAWAVDTPAARRAHFYVPLADGRALALPMERVHGILQVLHELYGDHARLPDTVRVPLAGAAALAALEGEGHLLWRGGHGLLDLARALARGGAPVLSTPPVGLKAVLRDYQAQGVAWLQFLREHALGGVLADDMGLGKTLQTLAHILVEKEQGRLAAPVLVLAPTSVAGSWLQEMGRFAPGLRGLLYHGAARRRAEDRLDVSAVDVLVTTYGVLLRDHARLSRIPFTMVVLDEAQAIKNPRAKLHAAVRAFATPHRLCLTGTPLQNNLAELWALFDFAMPGLLGDASSFRATFGRPIEVDADADRRAALVRRIKPFLLRRNKDDVTRELPTKTEMTHSIVLDGKQRDLYEAVRSAVDERVRKEIRAKGLARASIVVLDALLKLRQVCCDPRLVGLESARRVFESAKLTHLFEILPPLLEEGRRVLLFSQFTGMLALIAQELERRGTPYLQLTGRTRNRAALIERFQAGEAPLFLISLKAGGTGINLPRADTVIHYDPWWNPAIEDQATDRAHRIGQTQPVFVYKLIVERSVEAKMLQIQERKRALFNALMSGGSLASRLTEDDLDDLLAPL